jgi:hypothetical protein
LSDLSLLILSIRRARASESAGASVSAGASTIVSAGASAGAGVRHDSVPKMYRNTVLR